MENDLRVGDRVLVRRPESGYRHDKFLYEAEYCGFITTVKGEIRYRIKCPNGCYKYLMPKHVEKVPDANT